MKDKKERYIGLSEEQKIRARFFNCAVAATRTLYSNVLGKSNRGVGMNEVRKFIEAHLNVEIPKNEQEAKITYGKLYLGGHLGNVKEDLKGYNPFVKQEIPEPLKIFIMASDKHQSCGEFMYAKSDNSKMYVMSQYEEEAQLFKTFQLAYYELLNIQRIYPMKIWAIVSR